MSIHSHNMRIRQYYRSLRSETIMVNDPETIGVITIEPVGLEKNELQIIWWWWSESYPIQRRYVAVKVDIKTLTMFPGEDYIVEKLEKMQSAVDEHVSRRQAIETFIRTRDQNIKNHRPSEASAIPG